jgi:hypothetical protein
LFTAFSLSILGICFFEPSIAGFKKKLKSKYIQRCYKIFFAFKDSKKAPRFMAHFLDMYKNTIFSFSAQAVARIFSHTKHQNLFVVCM